jgi:hypothetical protein
MNCPIEALPRYKRGELKRLKQSGGFSLPRLYLRLVFSQASLFWLSYH